MKFNTIYLYAITLAVATFALAVISYIVSGQALWWGVTGAESQMGGVFWSLFGLHVSNLAYYHVYPIPKIGSAFTWFLVFGIILGSFAASLARGEFSIRQVPNRNLAIQALAGGILIGYGTRMAGGCNIGDFYTGFATGSFWAFPFFLSMVSGIYLVIQLSRYRPTSGFFISAKPTSSFIWPSRKTQYAVLSGVIIVVAILIYFFQDAMVRIWLIFGLIIGSVGYLGTLCFQTSFRETIGVSKERQMIRAIAISLLAVSILAQITILVLHMRTNFFFDQNQSVLYQILGGFIFGIGMGLSFNCTYSMEWRMGSGNVQALITFVGLTFIGAPLYAVSYSFWHSFIPVVVAPAPYWQFSIYRYGVPGALVIDLFPVVWLLVFGYRKPRSNFRSSERSKESTEKIVH
ncbi:YeeE/YedE thiosulfate transporter family protein [Thermoplasma sp.]|uniref:YeeE/YedE thiosulfate transporter family protein n=1 Tax=Thermoplasma sp. TaxID=1973142 RepID=UPI0025DCCD90|nr:YeeE/YedE thiosulfate transporter family protein [Thermoplasma sp.]